MFVRVLFVSVGLCSCLFVFVRLCLSLLAFVRVCLGLFVVACFRYRLCDMPRFIFIVVLLLASFVFVYNCSYSFAVALCCSRLFVIVKSLFVFTRFCSCLYRRSSLFVFASFCSCLCLLGFACVQ